MHHKIYLGEFSFGVILWDFCCFMLVHISREQWWRIISGRGRDVVEKDLTNLMSGRSKTIAAFNSSAFSSNKITLSAQRTHRIYSLSLQSKTSGSFLSGSDCQSVQFLFIKKNSPAPLIYQSFLQTTRFSLSPLFNLLYCGPRV